MLILVFRINYYPVQSTTVIVAEYCIGCLVCYNIVKDLFYSSNILYETVINRVLFRLRVQI